MILIIDNYDSFVHNLARYFRQLGCQTEVRRNDSITVDEIKKRNPQAIVISPGPCSPDEAGISLEIVKQLHDSFPILGICLGHQAIIQAVGGAIIRSDEPMHGRTSRVLHQGTDLFASIPDDFIAGRYHSLVGEKVSLPKSLAATAHTEDGTLMAVEHRWLPVFGLQFHPESILTEFGYQLVSNFLTIANIDHQQDAIPALQASRRSDSPKEQQHARPYPVSGRLSKQELP